VKSLRIAVYSLIVLHFLRKTARKLSPDRPGKPHGDFRGNPVQVGVGITYTNLHPSPDGSRSTYDYFRVATCIDFYTASALAETLNDMEPGYGHGFSLVNPVEEFNGYKLEVLKSDRIHLLRDNIRKCPDPDRLARMMQSAAISVILHEANPHC
jgi:hypothetical protein